MMTDTVQTPLSTISSGAARRPFSSLEIVIRMADRVFAWQARAAERRRLLTFDDRMLRDIGVDRATAIEEGSKPFWRE